MNNIEFLKAINASICKIDDMYYVKIPFILYNELNSYLENYNNCIYIKITDEFLANTDIEYFISAKDDTYEFIENPENDVIIKKSTDYDYYAIINDVITDHFSEDEINMAYQTFANIIKTYAYITDVSLKTQIYKNIIDFYANGKTDNILATLTLLLNSSNYTYTDNSSSISLCGCNSNVVNSNSTSSSGTTLDPTSSTNCADIYLNAIALYTPQMFGDPDFYYNFFCTEDGEPNSDIIDMLITLLNDVLELLNNGQNIYGTTSAKHNHCLCGELNTSIDNTTFNIILNYIKVLEWVKNCEIEENINKIQVYGNQFGEIFPNLYFV